MEGVAVILPPLCFAMIYAVCCARERVLFVSLRQSLLLAAVVWGILVVVITEGTSLAGLFAYSCLTLVWGIVLGAFGVVCMKQLSKRSRVRFSLFPCASGFLNFLILGIIGISLFSLSVALIAPPNTWDSMTYHMSRVMHWVQNKNVGFYPTNIERQLHQPPWSEFVIAQFQILSHSDRYANLVQWFSMMGSILGITLIAQELGADTRGQILSAVVAATLPMGILQSSSTQNDWVVGFWLICFAYFVLVARKNLGWSNTLGAGGSLGLALLTKGTGYIYAFPLVIWLGVFLFKNFSWKRCGSIFVLGIIAFPINLGYFQRNYSLYASPLGPSSESMTGDFSYVNDVFSFSAFSSNVIRNMAIHIGTPFGLVNQVIERGIEDLHKYVLLIDPNDPRTTWTSTQFRIMPPSNNEDGAGNPLHLVLIGCAIVFLIARRGLGERVLSAYLIVVCATFLLFALILKWQPWHSRLHLPFFLLSAPFVGITLSKISTQYANLIATLLILLALPWIVYNSSHPLIGRKNIFLISRIEQYFRKRPALQSPYANASNFIRDRGCSAVGLSLGGDDWEYPFWVMIQEDGRMNVRIEHVQVQTQSTVLSRLPWFDSFRPCVIISLDSDPPTEIVIGMAVYTKEIVFDPVSLYVKQLRD